MTIGALGNAYPAMFQGNALKGARALNIPDAFIDHFVQQQHELTSPFPLVGDAKMTSITGGVNVSAGDLLAAQSVGGQNSGRGGRY